MHIVGVVSGSLEVQFPGGEPLHLTGGRFCLIPASQQGVQFVLTRNATTILVCGWQDERSD
jgi:hypothetical protein